MKAKKNWYRQLHRTDQSVTVSNRTIMHPHIEESVIIFFAETPRSICNLKKCHAVQKQTICIVDVDQYYILNEI